MAVTRTPIDMIDTQQQRGTLESTGSSISITSRAGNNIEEFGGWFDDTSGTLTLRIPNIGEIYIQGFMTQGSIGRGKQGLNGAEGRSGVDGTLGSIGDQGSTGCEGPQGKEGRPGQRGARGIRGNVGPTGSTGATGRTGDTGRINVFIQSEDPGAVGAGSIWVKP